MRRELMKVLLHLEEIVGSFSALSTGSAFHMASAGTVEGYMTVT